MIRALVLLAVLLGIWELYCALSGIDPLVLPAPHEIARSLWEDRALLWDNLLVTAGEVVLGIALAALAGLACATAVHLSPPCAGPSTRCWWPPRPFRSR